MSYYNGHCDVCKKLKPLMSGICDDCAADNHEVADPAIRESVRKYMEKITNG